MWAGFELGIQRAFDNRPNLRNGLEGVSEDSPNITQPQIRPTCVGYSEIDKYAIATYEHNFGGKCDKHIRPIQQGLSQRPTNDNQSKDELKQRECLDCRRKGHTNYGDATKIDERQLPDFDLLVGGFPCQAFSVAGKRHGFDDTRGTLFFDVARILAHKRPKHLLLENVKGLLSHDSGKTFSTILGVLTDLGYDVEWQVLNAKDFGVPQNRERVFIVGHLGEECRHQVFPIRGSSQQTASVAGYISEEVWPRRHEQIRRVYKTDGAMPTIPTGTGGGVMTKISVPVLTPDRLEKRQNGRRFKTDGEPSFTLNTQDKHGVYDGMRIRRLTPLECERLMSWPDNWTIGSDTQRYKQCGNGVVSNCVQAVIEELKPCLL